MEKFEKSAFWILVKSGNWVRCKPVGPCRGEGADGGRSLNKAYGAAVAAVMGKAKILNLITDRIEDVTKPDFNAAQSMQDIGRGLLQSVGFKEPDDVSIAAAIELNDTFVDGLQRIYQQAQQEMN